MTDIKNDISLMGVDRETYEKLLAIAKKQNKSVVDVMSEALGEHISKNQGLGESRKLLMEG